MCDHGDDKGNTWLMKADVPGYEVYVCECGALINIQDKKNYDKAQYAMTSEEIEEMIECILVDMKMKLGMSLTQYMVLHGLTL